ncbi:GrpB family protein [Nonomuraea typhae]|uniref:GrpB family protein n=1 Tax=Nonomuraea typhae TaxID=2603600 RepID=UPI0012FBB777|nr:GrpB family protein [Nonomuraea typhae]
MAAVAIVAYSPKWETLGKALVADMRAALTPPALRVEHIGSTSIPGMDGKPIFDLQVSVASLDNAEQALSSALPALGFADTTYFYDHVPAGSDDSPDLWRKRLWMRREAGPDVNLHIRQRGYPGERFALLFRDWFRAHPKAVPAYRSFKWSLAQAVRDPAMYTEMKNPVVDLVVAMAEDWVSRTGWRVDSAWDSPA